MFRSLRIVKLASKISIFVAAAVIIYKYGAAITEKFLAVSLPNDAGNRDELDTVLPTSCSTSAIQSAGDVSQRHLIIFWTKWFIWDLSHAHTDYFLNIKNAFSKCPQLSCELTDDKTQAAKASAFVYHGGDIEWRALPPWRPSQFQVFLMHEPPVQKSNPGLLIPHYYVPANMVQYYNFTLAIKLMGNKLDIFVIFLFDDILQISNASFLEVNATLHLF